MFYKLPPAGDPITMCAISSPEAILKDFFGEGSPCFYGSGTAALAAAVVAVTRLKPRARPEILVPAYSCPALVSAVLFAGAKPVLVDFERDRPWLDLHDLARKLSSQTVGIVAVHLFGLPERVEQIQKIARDASLFLIEDSAQYLADQGSRLWIGDFVILSFGRGKPVSLLAGGAVLAREAHLADALPHGRNQSLLVDVAQKLQVFMYNRFLSPYAYWLPASLPFLHLGETRFEALKTISAASHLMITNVPGALAVYRHRARQAQDEIHAMMAQFESDSVMNLPKLCCGDNMPRLLRYPLLVPDVTLQDRLLIALDTAGLGASSMYSATLPHIRGLESLFGLAPTLPNAERFARTLITLPTHSGVTPEHVKKMTRILETMLRR